MQDEIWHQRSIQNYNGAVLSVYSVAATLNEQCLYRIPVLAPNAILPGFADGQLCIGSGARTPS